MGEQVYGIISAQLVLTCCTASLFIFSKPVNEFATQSVAFQAAMFILPLIGTLQSAKWFSHLLFG